MLQMRWNSVTFISPEFMNLLILRRIASQVSVIGESESESESPSSELDESDSIVECGRLRGALSFKRAWDTAGCGVSLPANTPSGRGLLTLPETGAIAMGKVAIIGGRPGSG